MAIETIQSDVKSHTFVVPVADLVNKAVGAQDPVVLYKLSEGWEVESVLLETETDPAGTGTRTLSMGVVGTATAIFSAEDIEAAGRKAPTVTRYRATASIDIILTLTTGTSNPTTGVLRISVLLHKVRKEA